MFQSADQQFAKQGLQQMEAPMLKMLGFGGGKPDGSASNPMYTKDASGAKGASPGDQQTHGILGKILGIFHLGGADGGKPDGSQSNPFYIQPAAGGGFGGESLGLPTGGGSGGGGGMWSGLASIFGGFMADGGALDSGSWYVAGERGPEIVSGVNGRAFNSSETGGMLGRGSGAFYNVNVPAGVSHEEFERTMGRMLTAVHGSAVHSSVAVMQEHARRAVAR